MNRFPAVTLVLALGLALPAAADEGMWTFDDPPTKVLQEKYGFTPTKDWLDKVRLASVRFNDGGSGSFVSPEGLMITNHHVGLNCIQNLSTTEHDYVNEGYLTPSRDKEPACPGYEVNVLQSIENVSARVLGAVKPGMTDKAAGDGRKAAMAQIEKECADRTKNRCDVIELYQGGEYHLYEYKKYTDVRLVFAPEQQAAFFGGDPDNFTFPRHDLDISIFRAYENGRPARPAGYLRWSRSGAADDELVFVSGNPGSTSRLDTMTELASHRDLQLPFLLKAYKRRLDVLRAYSEKSPENERRAKAAIFGLENTLKAWTGELEALEDKEAMGRKEAAEKELRAKIAADPELAKATGDPWAAIAEAQKKADARNVELHVLGYPNRRFGFRGSSLLNIAGLIVQYAAEKTKPNESRLPEFRESNLESLENALYSTAPIYPDVEEVMLADRLQETLEALGPDHPYVKAVLGGRTPAQVAHEAVSGTKLADVAVRQALVKGGAAAVKASTDPMIVLARRIDPVIREIRRFAEDDYEASVTRAGEKIAQARFKLFGHAMHPDATFTLRLAFGVVKGYPAEGTMVPPRTTFHGLYDRSASFGNKEPWNLTPRWQERKAALELATPLNFVNTADIIGGNSGSPVINRAGEFVGIIFDGNIESLAADYFYTEEKARAVAVESRAIVEALRKVYDAGAVADELTGAR
jgi:hypothetical protein